MLSEVYILKYGHGIRYKSGTVIDILEYERLRINQLSIIKTFLHSQILKDKHSNFNNIHKIYLIQPDLFFSIPIDISMVVKHDLPLTLYSFYNLQFFRRTFNY